MQREAFWVAALSIMMVSLCGACGRPESTECDPEPAPPTRVVVAPVPKVVNEPPEPPGPDPAPKPSSIPPEGFIDAYKRAGSPRLLAYGHVISGVNSAGQAIHAANTEQWAMLNSFLERLKQELRHPRVTLVTLSEAQFEQRDQFSRLNNNLAKANLLVQVRPADLVIIVDFWRVPDRPDGTLYSVDFHMVDVKRSTEPGGSSFEMKADQHDPPGVIGMRRQALYARKLSELITKQMILANPDEVGSPRSAQDFVIEIRGLPDDKVKPSFDIVSTLLGVKEILRSEFKSDGGEIDVSYAGESISLADAARQKIAGVLDMDVKIKNAVAGRVVLQAQKRPVEGDCVAMLNDDSNDAQSKAKIRPAYIKMGEPKIAVLVNREPVESMQQPNPKSMTTENGGKVSSTEQASQILKFYVNSIIDDNRDTVPLHRKEFEAPDVEKDRRTDREYLNARVIENQVEGRLSRLGLQAIDMRGALLELRNEQKLTKEVYGERELAELIGDNGKADVVIVGSGTVDNLPSSPIVDVFYTFNMHNVKGSGIRATATVDRRKEWTQWHLAQDTGKMAAEATARLICMAILGETEQRIDVELQGAKSTRDVIEMVNAVEKLNGVARAIYKGFRVGKEDAGIGYFEIVYTTSCKDLTERLLGTTGLPFNLDGISSNCNVLRMKARDK